MGDPSPEAWSRVHRYASWMHHVHVDEKSVLGEETFRKLRLNSPAGEWFPALQGLTWCITRSNHPYVDLFFSPHLTSVDIFVPPSWKNSEVPRNILPAITSVISALPTPTLRTLFVEVDCHGTSSSYFKDSLSSVILRCGPSLTRLFSPIPLSDAAINHLIHLPHLRHWHIEYPPPNYSTSSLPLVFPPLKDFLLVEGAARGWLSLFKRLVDRVSSTQDMIPLSRIKESLESLMIEDFTDSTIDVSLASTIQTFRNLDHLKVEFHCDGDGGLQCAFKLNDENIIELAMALPRLEVLFLGHPCYENSCATTIACLLQISVHCVKLRSLEIHFNTTNIVDDFKNLSGDPRFQELRLLPKCALSCLDVCEIPFALDESDFETVADGMADIFPYLERCDGLDEIWDGLNEKIVWVQRKRP